VQARRRPDVAEYGSHCRVTREEAGLKSVRNIATFSLVRIA
jgi:hypothetical protein